MLRNILILFFMLSLSACATNRVQVTTTDPNTKAETVTTMTEAAFAQKVISENKPKSTPCRISLKDLDPESQRMALFMQSHGQRVDLCGNQAIASTGRNYFDMKTEKSANMWNGLANISGDAKDIITLKTLTDGAVDLVGTVAKNSGDRYNVDATQNNQTYNTAGNATSNDGLDGIPEGEAGLGGIAGTGGSGGPANGDQSAARTNVFNIGGGDIAIAGERAASGQSYLNGDSASQAAINDSDVKQSPVGDDQQGLDNSNDTNGDGANGGFDDGDGTDNGVDF